MEAGGLSSGQGLAAHLPPRRRLSRILIYPFYPLAGPRGEGHLPHQPGNSIAPPPPALDARTMIATVALPGTLKSTSAASQGGARRRRGPSKRSLQPFYRRALRPVRNTPVSLPTTSR